MNNLAKSSALGAAIVTAMLPLACCWGPTLLAGVAVLSGAAGKIALLHPYEPWLYAVSFFSLGYSHFKAFKSQKEDDAGCQSCAADEAAVSASGVPSKIVLWVATGLVVIMFLVSQFPEWFI
jgi:hypothetical protein